MRLRRANFEGPRAIEDFDFHFNPKIPKSKIEMEGDTFRNPPAAKRTKSSGARST